MILKTLSRRYKRNYPKMNSDSVEEFLDTRGKVIESEPCDQGSGGSSEEAREA